MRYNRLLLPARHGVPVIGDAEVFCEVVCATDERQLDAEVIEKEHLKTLPLLLPCLRFVLNTQTQNIPNVMQGE